jgi:hypothetical protein
LLFVLFYELFVCKCVLYYCHRVTSELQLINIYHRQVDVHLPGYEGGTDRVFRKRRHINFGSRRITQKKAYNKL